jgi:hypothetical protein
MDPGPAVKNLNYPKCFLAKYDASGALVFYKDLSTFEVTDNIYADASNIVLTTDDEGSVYAAGYFFSEDYYNTIPNHSADKSKYSVNLLKFDATGKYVYATRHNYGALSYLYSMAAGPDKSVCVAGYHDEAMILVDAFDAAGKSVRRGDSDATIWPAAAFDNNGTLYFTSALVDQASFNQVQMQPYKVISKTAMGNYGVFFLRSKTGLYTCGHFYEPTADLNFFDGTDTHTSTGGYDIYFSRYDLE